MQVKELKIRDCLAKGIKDYEVEDIIPIPSGIKSGTNIRLESKVFLLLFRFNRVMQVSRLIF
jgi:hypothetical protein